MAHIAMFRAAAAALLLSCVLAACSGNDDGDPEGVNQAPSVQAGNDQLVDEGAAGTLAAAAVDPDGTIAAYFWEQTAGPPAALTTPQQATTAFAAPQVSQDTALVFRVTAVDNSGGSAFDTVTVTVRDLASPPPAGNLPPVANAGPDRAVIEGNGVVLAGSAGDPDGTIATIAWTQLSGPPVTLADAGTLTPSFVAPQVAAPTTLTFRLTVTDDAGASASDEIAVDVSDVPGSNLPPQAAAGADRAVDEGTLVALAGSGTDSDGSVVAYSWQQIAGPAVTLAGANTATATFVAPQVPAATALAFRLTVTDDDGATAADDVVVTVRDVPGSNQPPTAQAGPDQVVNEGTLVTLAGVGTDSDGTIASYQWAQTAGLPATLSGTTTPVATFTAPAVAAPSVLTFLLTVTDDDGATATDSVDVTVNDVVIVDPNPPQLKAGVAKRLVRVPVGVPLGGYLRPPVGGDYIPGLEGFAAGDPSVFFAEFLDFLPTEQDHDGNPLAPLPDELRTITSPYATFSPPSRGYYDSLNAKAVALFDGEDYIVLVKTDFIGMLDEVVQAVADQVQVDTGIDLHDGLIMSATHTHGGPGALANHSTRYFWLAMDVYQPDLFNRLVPDFVAVVKEALADLQPARFGYAMGREAYTLPLDPAVRHLNSFRRGRLNYDPDKNNALRERIGVMRVDTAAGEPLAVVMNYAAHGIAFDVENLYFSGDVLGAAEREVERLIGAEVAMLVQNTGGDVSPRADGPPTLQRIERFGRLLAPQVQTIWQGIESFDTRPDLRAVSQRVILSRERLGYQGQDYPYPWGAAQCYGIEGMPTGTPIECLPAPPPDPIDIDPVQGNGVAENGAFVPQDTRLTAAKIGDALLLAQPGEPLTEYGVRLLALAETLDFDADDTFIWGYSQDHIGYILAPVKEDWQMGGTEGTTTFWGWLQGQRFLDAQRELMIALRDNTAPPLDEFQVDYFYRDLYALATPLPVTPSVFPGRLVSEPGDIQRFQQTAFAWEGRDPVVDLPTVELQRENGSNNWEPVLRANGDKIKDFYEMHLKYRLVSGAHVWSVEFEPPKDWPAGRYRFDVDGGTPEQDDPFHYALSSSPFTVAPSPSLQISTPLTVGGITEVTLAYTPRPTNYRLIDEHVGSGVPAPVRAGTVTFTNGTTTVTDSSPDVLLREGVLVAVYRAAIGGTVTASGVDAFGNTTPAP